MRRKVFLLSVILTLGLGSFFLVGLATNASEISSGTLREKVMAGKLQGPVTVTVTPVSPSDAQVTSTINSVKTSATVAKFLNKTETVSFKN